MNAFPQDLAKQYDIIKCVTQSMNLLSKPTYPPPGRRDTIAVKRNGVKYALYKRHLLFDIREIHQLFLNDNPGVQISRSKFAELRPKNVLYKSTLAHRVCICIIYENINLILQALSKHVNGNYCHDLSTFTSRLVCDENNHKCMISACGQCKGNFNQFITTKHYLVHVWTKRQQSQYFKQIKQEADDENIVIQVYYSENFQTREQNEIQSARCLTHIGERHQLHLMWHFFAMSHGKGAVDRLGGTVKRTVYGEIMADKQCKNAKDFTKIAQEKTPNIILCEITTTEIAKSETQLKQLFSKTKPVNKTLQIHCVKAVKKDVIEYCYYSNSKEKFTMTF
ncbi:unnamed protein product [Didymodactylos carnosus]|uniref:Uncharacterized protein n=1 Tax=Didymodactylos carnosus TaxID=1234261 RepID=A0A814I2L8_9BILA|nr:unnamed protein product [Didymodactylos carnosus]CAF1018759.1 unnamed protein product [Didymodactylos carnosus]CAF3745633.1 unnamed protein product [Didymodactylos carnosus]CAF3790261.1 unnamed protein product [Didymodactylos carnosus]